MQEIQATNLLKALINLKSAGFPNLQTIYRGHNRINSVGESLEYYIKDMFADTFKLDNIESKENVYRDYFSWLGNPKNPPDFILKGSDAVEVKKTEGLSNDLALNSSYPKDYLYADNTTIVKGCRECEGLEHPWRKKDLIYVVGATDNEKIISLWMVYGSCYSANREVYERIVHGLKAGISDIADIGFEETKELARVNRIDPLGITDLRVRGMWIIDAPHKVFKYLTDMRPKTPKFHALMLKEKFNELKLLVTENELQSLQESCTIKAVEVINPNNPAQKLEAVLIVGDLKSHSELL